MAKNLLALAYTGALTLLLSACSSMGGSLTVTGNENGTQPVNQKEAVEYQKAILKCYKTGGSRIVKISGELRCF